MMWPFDRKKKIMIVIEEGVVHVTYKNLTKDEDLKLIHNMKIVYEFANKIRRRVMNDGRTTDTQNKKVEDKT